MKQKRAEEAIEQQQKEPRPESAGISVEDRIMDVLGSVSDIVLLNLLFVVCSLPVVTIGASLTALYGSLFRLARGEGTLYTSFFRTFKASFGQATLLFLELAAAFAVLVADIYLTNMIGSALAVVGIALFCVAILLGLCMSQYVFALLASYPNPLKRTVKNAFLMSLRHAPKSLLMILFWALPVLAWAFVESWFFQYGFHWLLFCFALPAYGNVLVLKPIFAHYQLCDRNHSGDETERQKELSESE